MGRSEHEPFVEARGLYKVFGDDPEHALELLRKGADKGELLEQTNMAVGVRDASFEVRRGEIFVVMGLSGSGKSTLLRLVNRLIAPTKGTLRVRGSDVVAMSESELTALRRESMAMVFQSFALMPHLNVLHNVAFGLSIRGVPLRERRERAMEALSMVGLEGNAASAPDELSGGMQQRVGLARALCVDPELLLMDEAFSALDPLIRDDMQAQLLELQRERPRTILFVSHDLDEAMRLGDRIAIMDAGRIVQIGTPQELIRAPANDFVRSFVASVDTSRVLTAGDLAEPLEQAGEGPGEALDADAAFDRVARRVLDSTGPVAVRDGDGELVGWVSKDTLIKHVAGLS